MWIFIALLLTPVLLAGVFGLIVWCLGNLGLVQKRWAMMVLTMLGMISIPVIWFVVGINQAEQCRAEFGPDARSCAGEMGFVMIFFYQLFLGICSLVMGPLVGGWVHKRLTNGEK